jgi:two-component system, NtrC family, sensor kinase
MNEEIKILFVDDEQNVLNAINRAFIDEDYKIVTATSGQEGLEYLKEDIFQVVVSDYRMPGLNGIEFLRKVYNNWPETVRIVLSGYADVATIVEALNEGQIYKFIPKPWNDNDLKITISNALERYFLYKRNMELTKELSKKNEDLENLNMQLNKLLEEQSINLEFRSKIVDAYQNILDSIPVGIVGIDSTNMIALCNSSWTAIMEKGWCGLGETADNILKREEILFIEKIRREKTAKKKAVICGIPGTLSGSLMKRSNDQEGVILVFAREDDLP